MIFLYHPNLIKFAKDTAPVDQGCIQQILGERLAQISDGCWPRAKIMHQHPWPNLLYLGWLQQLSSLPPLHEHTSILTLLLNLGIFQTGMSIPWQRGPWLLLHPMKNRWYHLMLDWIRRNVPQTLTLQSPLWVFILAFSNHHNWLQCIELHWATNP